MQDSTGFDIDAWLTDARPPMRSVTVYGRGDLVAVLQDLAAERDALRGDISDGDTQAGLIDDRLGDYIPVRESVTVDALDAEIAAIRAELDLSRLTLHVRAVLHVERNALIDEHTTKDDKGADTLDSFGYEEAFVAAAADEPRLTRIQAAGLHKAIGEGQWLAVCRAIEAASSETIDVPLAQLG
jgi:hypothetical protein